MRKKVGDGGEVKNGGGISVEHRTHKKKKQKKKKKKTVEGVGRQNTPQNPD